MKKHHFTRNIRKNINVSTEDKLARLIEDITHTGQLTLDVDLMKQIKTICRNNPNCIDAAFKSILKFLRKKHCEVRLSSFQLCAELFKRSHDFRLLVIDNLEEIVINCVGTEKNKLPPPKHAAVKVKRLAMLTVPKWKEEFGKHYQKLVLGCDYLTNVEHIDFEAFVSQEARAEEARDVKEKRDEEIKQQVVRNLIDSFNGDEPLFEETIETINNCCSLLLPHPEDFFVATSDCEDVEECCEESSDPQPEPEPNNDTHMRLHGFNPSFNLVISIDPSKKLNIPRSAENGAIMDNLKENLKLAKKRLFPCLKKLEMNIGNVQLDSDHELVKKIRAVKERLERCVNKSKGFRMDGGNESSTDDDDMEEVVKEGYEPSVLPIVNQPHPYFSSTISTPGCSLKNVAGSFTFNGDCAKPDENTNTSCSKNDVTMVASCSKMACPVADQTSKEKKKCVDKAASAVGKDPGPTTSVVARDVDSYDAEYAGAKTTSVVSMKMGKWGSGDMELDEMAVPEALMTRVVEYTESFEPVTRSCRAPLLSGELCPRMDRYKCPFHGKIVPRDINGKCVNPDDEITSSSTKTDEAVPEWQDPVLLAQLKAMTGIDLKMPEKKGARRKRSERHPGLTDLKKLKNTTKVRLKKKLFNKSTMRRMAAVVNKVDRRQ